MYIDYLENVLKVYQNTYLKPVLRQRQLKYNSFVRKP